MRTNTNNAVHKISITYLLYGQILVGFDGIYSMKIRVTRRQMRRLLQLGPPNPSLALVFKGKTLLDLYNETVYGTSSTAKPK